MTEEAKATEKPTGLALLRVPFAAHHISKLPKPTKEQTEAVRNDFKKGIRCKLCRTWHHPDVVHLDYVGHAAATDRLLDADPQWNWEPVPDPAAQGLPVHEGCMWIKLTVCGVSRYGVGDADGKVGGNAIKEVIGDAIRNAGMRFGMALDLWHKGDLHVDEQDEEPAKPEPRQRQQTPAPAGPISNEQFLVIADLIDKTNTDSQAFCKAYGIATVNDLPAAKLADATKALNNKLKKQEAAQ